jgi:hypothetical protein
MPHVSGTVSSLPDLLQAVKDACTANGWTLAGNVLSKGGTYVQLIMVDGAPLASGTQYFSVRGGTGIDGSNNLTGAGTAPCYIGPLGSTTPIVAPIAYDVHIHTAPDEVYLIAQYAVEYYQWAAFGKSPVAGLATGTGIWYGASISNRPRLNSNCNVAIDPSGTMDVSQIVDRPTSAALFWNNPCSAEKYSNAFVHHGWDSTGWSGTADVIQNASPNASANAAGQLAPRIARQPNTWNGETVLMPIQPSVARGSGWRSIVGDLAHARYVRNDNLAPGEIITLGPDRWRVYPWFRKFAAARDGGKVITHSGTLGWAIRYDGP